MIKKIFLHTVPALFFALFAETGYTAEFNAATSSAPAQILIRHAVVETASGIKHLTIRLIAKDGSNLHDNQIYQAQFSATSASSPQDGTYNEQGEEIFIPKLLQNGSAAQQTTLRLINRKTMEFEVFENTLISTESDPAFNPNQIHNANHYYSE